MLKEAGFKFSFSSESVLLRLKKKRHQSMIASVFASFVKLLFVATYHSDYSHKENFSKVCLLHEIVKPVRFRSKFCSKTASADFQLTAQEYIGASILCFAAFAR